MYLMVGSACTLLAGAAAFYLLDYLKQAPMGTTINTIKDAIQQPGANGLEKLPAIPPRDLASIRIPELRIAEDASLEERKTSRFQLRLDDSMLSSSSLPSPLPEDTQELPALRKR